ncbi:hypothetical protein [Deinococcus sp. 6GRE01]|uniref:hypothetical protein n=1 Tax=Deinococcus sp. 6GRE01 TaxID=2745873 RepID=UPI001E2B52EE|nr:hypothetical protein [Deinococcus sp. 6GRE01]MCD0156911.1 hypothetical protein [Deinococcus sp. 6GRE01]
MTWERPRTLAFLCVVCLDAARPDPAAFLPFAVMGVIFGALALALTLAKVKA